MRIGLLGLGLLVASACTGTIDAPGGGDDMPPPATDVQMVVRDGFTPQAGVRVIFQDAADTVLLDTATDATGMAKFTMDTGNVTVVRTFPILPAPAPRRAPEVYTYVGVKAGDKLVLGDATSNGTPNAIVVKVPDGANGTVKVETPCGSGQGTAPNIAITVTDCPAMVDFYVTDGDQSSFFKRMPFAGNVDLSLETLSGNLAATIASTNVLPNTQVNVEERVETGTFQLFTSGDKRVDQTPATVNLPNLTGVDQLVLATIRPAGGGTQMIAARSTYSASPVVVDASADLLPSVADAKYLPASISWTETGTGTADAVVASLRITRSGPVSLDNEYTRLIIAPHTGLTMRMPLLPDALYNPVTGDQIAGTHGLVKASGGYDQIRTGAFSVANVVEAAALDGKVTLSYAGNTPPGL